MHFGIFNHGTNMGAAGSPKAATMANWLHAAAIQWCDFVLNQRIIKFRMYLVHFRLNLLVLDFSNSVARISYNFY
jgi:hypothetical protein